MNTIIGVNNFHHSGVNSIANFGDNSRFDHGVNTMSKICVNTNIRSGDNTRTISSYKAHKAKRTYKKKKDRIGVNTSSISDNRYTAVGTCDVKSRICWLLMHNPSAKRMDSAVIKNWINSQAKETSMKGLSLFVNTSCSGIYETPSIEWNIFHQVILQCIRDDILHSLLPRQIQAGRNSCWAHMPTFNLAVKSGCQDIIHSGVRKINNMVLTPLLVKQTEPSTDPDQDTACPSKALKTNHNNNVNNDTNYCDHFFSNEENISCLTQPDVFTSPKSKKVPTPPSSDDGNKTLSARQVDAPATMNSVAVNGLRESKLFESDESEEEDELHKQDGIEVESSKGKETSEYLVLTPIDDLQCYKNCKMVHK